MTTQQIVENILTVFPKVKEQQIIHDLDDLQKTFCNETGILTGVGTLSDISTTVGWNLPSDFIELQGIEPLRFYDSDGKPKYIGDYNYAYEIQFNKFYIYSLTSTSITGLNTDIDTAYLHYKRKPTTITSRSIALEIPEEFSKGLEHGLLADYFGKYTTPILSNGQIVEVRDLNSASFHLNRYDKYRIAAKRYANSREEDNISEVWNYQHAGSYQLPRRSKDSSLGSTSITQITSLGNIYKKFALYNITNSDGAKSTSVVLGYTTLSANKSGTTLTLSSTGEFSSDTHIICNNGNVSWETNSTSEIVFTLPGLFTLISIEIWERI